MLRGYGRTLDVALLLMLLILAVVVLVLFTLPEPPPKPTPTATLVPAATATPTVTPTPQTLPTLRPTMTPSATPTEPATPTAAPTIPAATSTSAPTAPPGSTATPLPLVARGAPLPHSALFVRRHNDFAEPSTVGIEDLLESGVTVDGTPVILDDVAPLSGIRVPGPEQGDEAAAGHTLALRYGITEIPLTEKRDPRATHYLEVALKAASDQEALDTEAPPANYVFVVDTSGSMEGRKLNGVKVGIRALFEEMRPQDTLGIVDFDVQTRTALPATAVEELTLNAVNVALNRLIAAGGTDVNLGLQAGIEEVAGIAEGGTINHVFLFSDGNPTDGVTEWLAIRENVVAALREITDRDVGLRVSTFAFGDDANGRELDALAGITGGTYTPVSDPEDLGLILNTELARRAHLAAKDIRLALEIDPSITILHLFGHDQVAQPIARAALGPPGEAGEAGEVAPEGDTEEEGIRIFVPDLAVGETYWVVLELAIPATQDDLIGEATATYVDTVASQPRSLERELSRGAAPLKLPEDLVLRHALGLWTSEVAFYALDDVRQDDLETAAARLGTHLGHLETAYEDLLAVWLTDDIAMVEKLQTLAKAEAQRSNADRRSLLLYGLDTLGRARSGFTRVP
ncbi:MAG: VWA domain-containing protein [Anaerolineae bacterium]